MDFKALLMHATLGLAGVGTGGRKEVPGTWHSTRYILAISVRDTGKDNKRRNLFKLFLLQTIKFIHNEKEF